MCNCFKDKVKCEVCKHYIDKKDSQIISYEVCVYPHEHTEEKYYCPLHKRNYDIERVEFTGYRPGITGSFYYKIIPRQEIRVNEDGSEIKRK